MKRTLVASVVAAATVGVGIAGTPAGGGQQTSGPFDLVSLRSLGTVTWRCGPNFETYGLGFRPAADAATPIRLTLTAGGRIRARASIAKGERLGVRLLRLRRQELRLSQPTGAGTLGARVSVDFGAGVATQSCYSHLPPRTVARFGPRG